jgi:hypothetical protein
MQAYTHERKLGILFVSPGRRALHSKRKEHRLGRRVECGKEGVASGFHLVPARLVQQFPEYPPVFLNQFRRAERAVLGLISRGLDKVAEQNYDQLRLMRASLTG